MNGGNKMPEPNDRFFFYVALDMPEGAILPEKAKQLKKRVREKGDKAGGGGEDTLIINATGHRPF